MIPLSRPQKSKNPCSICVKRKVKCDRGVPCSNCRKRGEEESCTASYRVRLNKAGSDLAEYKVEFLQLWYAYRFWVFDYGLLQKGNTCWSLKGQQQENRYNWKLDNERADLWIGRLNSTMSFKLLDFAVEKLGGLFFGILGDVSELYMELEEYWTRMEDPEQLSSPDNYLWDAVLWSIFTLTVYYIPLETLETIISDSESTQFSEAVLEEALSETKRAEIFSNFTNVVRQLLQRANFLEVPNVKTIQTYLILACTSICSQNLNFANSLLTHCLHLAKCLQIDLFRPLVADASDVRLIKLSCEKLWYRLSAHDFWQSGLNKPISIHETNSSLLNHAAFLMDKPNVDVYRSEDTFEALVWKVTSLDRDLDKYFGTQTKPPLKTLDAVQRQLDIFLRKSEAFAEDSSTTAHGEKFIITFLLNAVNWKLNNMVYSYYDQDAGWAKLCQCTTLMIAQVLHNEKIGMAYLNKIPIVLPALVTTLGFHSMSFIFDESSLNEQLAMDLMEVCQQEHLKSNGILRAASSISQRLRELRRLWRNVRVVDDGNTLNHPVFRILLDDIRMMQDDSKRLHRIFLKPEGMEPKVRDNEEEEAQSEEFMRVVRNFESAFDLQIILS
ncbi:LADA_0C02102g1_1 [Lachancea dasiensis]|uniref:LADA_0C02102g1_1 n=1 Tax=Lachancea dasiensis TaxID=1072105 RepID=A0A1G4IXS1_9SACH|nr:LADA_0C02102g1_1 [Lachancea dasiensis]